MSVSKRSVLEFAIFVYFSAKMSCSKLLSAQLSCNSHKLLSSLYYYAPIASFKCVKMVHEFATNRILELSSRAAQLQMKTTCASFLPTITRRVSEKSAPSFFRITKRSYYGRANTRLFYCCQKRLHYRPIDS